MDYETKRAEFIANLRPGDFVSWTTFDGSGIYEVDEITDKKIILAAPVKGGRRARWPRTGTVHRDHYGGFDETLGPVGKTQLEYFMCSRQHGIIDPIIKGMDAEQLSRLTDCAVMIQTSKE